MKTQLLLIYLCCLAFFNANGQYVSIPDSNFRNYLITQIPACFNGAKQMDTTCKGVLTLQNMQANTRSITDFTGIGYFKSLRIFSCANNLATSLPTLPDSLTSLVCSNNKLKSLPALPKLSRFGLYCENNQLTKLPSLPDSLINLRCWGNPSLYCLPVLPKAMMLLAIDTNNISCLPNYPASLSVFADTTFKQSISFTVCNGSFNPKSCTLIPSTYVNIPDSIFRNLLIAKYPACFNGAGQMDTTCADVVNETNLKFSNNKPITSVSGIEYFKNLVDLNLANNYLTTLPRLSNKLSSLVVDGNFLSKLPALPNNLKILSIASNNFSVCPSLSDSLINFNCASNQLSTLPSLPKKLKILDCNYNSLTTLPTLPNSVTEVLCSNNQIQNLPALPDSAVFFLDCSFNNIQSLPKLPDSLGILFCSNNPIGALPLKLPRGLGILKVGFTPISYLPSLDSMFRLQLLICEGDSNLSCLPKLPNSLISLTVTGTKINCIPNTVSKLTVTPSNLPYCNITNNSNHCQAFPLVFGKVFSDMNKNGVKDASEFYRPYVRLTLNSGQSAFTDSKGEFVISTDSIGSYTLYTQAPSFFSAIPDSSKFTLTASNSQLTLTDIALQTSIVKDSFNTAIISVPNTARPGRGIAYTTIISNVGTTTKIIYPQFSFDSTKLRFDSLVNIYTATFNRVGNVINISGDTITPGEVHDYKFYFTVKTSATLGDTLWVKSLVGSGGATLATTTFKQPIRTSYDPNSKEATPELSTLQVNNGQFIDYTIHFQNLGNDTAFNVVVADTLSSLLQSNVLQMIGSSHNCNVILKNGAIFFEFLDIHLPDSGANQLKSNGFVSFRLKPVSTLTAGSVVNNKAAIFFDYNKPVITNTATTLIKGTTLPVSLRNFMVKAGELAFNAEWVTATETNTAYFIVQRSTDGQVFSNVGNVQAKGAGAYQFADNKLREWKGLKGLYYRLQIVDKDGQISYSETKWVSLGQAASVPFVIYPNPAKHNIVLSGKGVSSVAIINQLGQKVWTKKTDSTSEVHQLTFQLPTGVYQLQIVDTNGQLNNQQLLIQ